MSYEQLIYEPGSVARIILNRPEFRNALSRVLFEEIDAAFSAAAADEAVKVIVLSGNGSSFCSGLDRGTPPEQADRERRPPSTEPRAQFERGWEQGVGRIMRLRAIPKPIIAMVQGHCINAGSTLAGGADLIFAAEDASFSFTDSQHPLLFDGPAGARKLKEILFEGRPVGAREALEIGFVSRVYANEDLERETLAYAEKVAQKHAWQLAMLKRSIDGRVEAMGLATALEAAHHALGLTRGLSGPPSFGRRAEAAASDAGRPQH